VIGRAVADACGEMGRMMARTRKRQLSKKSGDGRVLVLLLPLSMSCGEVEEEVLLVVSSSSTQAMMKRGNWKKEERHIAVMLMVGVLEGFSDGVDEEFS
jgi:hypothetical protein